MLRGVEVGHHERSGAAIFLTQDDVKRRTRIARMMEHERWDRVFSATCIGVPWQLRPDQRNLARPVVPEAEANQGVAPVIVMPAVPKTDRRRYVTKRDLVKYGYTDECQACTQLASGMHNAKVPHDDRCRDRIGELMAEDDDQRQVERVSGTVRPEVEIPRPEAGQEMDVGEPTVDLPQPVQQPVPTVRLGGSSSSGTRSGVGSRASETNTDDRETTRVRFTESRGQKRQGEDVEELAAKAEEQHLDADVEVPAHKTWRIEDVVRDAADAAPEQVNSFVQSKTEVFKKIEESLRPLHGRRQTDRQTDTTPRKAGHPSHISIATTKKVPFAFGDQLLTGRDGTLLCSAGPEWYGYLGIIDTEASTWAPAVGRPSKSAGCLAAQNKKKKLLSSVQKNVNLAAK